MSCIAADPRFRLLDHLVGWDEARAEKLAGLYDGEGMRLAGLVDGLTPDSTTPYLLPPRLARGCGPCEWYLATPPASTSRLLFMGACRNSWERVGPGPCFPIGLESVSAIAYDRNLLALADKASGKLWLLRAPGWQVLGEVDLAAPVALAFAQDWLAVSAEDGRALVLVSRNGRLLGAWPSALPQGRVLRLAFDRNGLLWLLVERHGGGYALFRQASKEDFSFAAADLDQLAAAFDPAGVTSHAGGFCLTRGFANGEEGPVCFDWYGRSPGKAVDTAIPPAPLFERAGQYLSGSIDSGVPRCRWHRLRLDADVPDGTALEVAVATSEDPNPAAQGLAAGDWAAFDAGLPHPDDWQVLPAGSIDALIRQPVGRYLFVRLRLTGDGSTTPRVRRVQLDFPRATSADLLPAVYRQDEAAGDFTERFLALFDAAMAEVEGAVDRFPALLDPKKAPPEALPWIASFLDIMLDDSWGAETRRRVLAAAPELFRKRGTRAGLLLVLQLVYGKDIEPLLTENGLERSWGAVAAAPRADGQMLPASARLGAVRLYSRKRSRITLDASPLGVTPIKSFGDPAVDAHGEGAFRFTVSLPPLPEASEASLLQLVDSMKPGHTLARVAFASKSGFNLGTGLKLGIDTLISRPQPRPLGGGALALGRTSILGGVPQTGTRLGMATLTPSFSSCTES